MENKKTLLIIVIALLIFIIIASGFGLYFIINSNAEKEDLLKVDKKIIMYSFEDSFISNVKDSKRILKITIKVELANSKIEDIITARNPEIRNEINLILREKNEEDLSGSEGQLKLQTEILEALRKLLKTEKILNVYFDEFIIN
ncbi:flagellar basal body-associated FliL family protein [Lutispora saccharofermentans]|uniref:Flagellar protein FliL n=1 Tax=Lutispora saccharofermentans TaxID=3024236 RepID=A0ABT1NCD2_9FIRM|nr:flagellar basal body-associated FliL family protein [Lutispora saccharofermentans]MCQ1527991.1 flagellar basal body-associated FliL family protein [Lutispora saccharofermentans]